MHGLKAAKSIRLKVELNLFQDLNLRWYETRFSLILKQTLTCFRQTTWNPKYPTVSYWYTERNDNSHQMVLATPYYYTSTFSVLGWPNTALHTLWGQ